MTSTTARVFVYGTLQPGYGNHNHFSGLWQDLGFRGTVRGRLYFAYPDGYPVAKFDDQSEEVIHGTFITVDTSCQEWERVCYMEEGAGYVPIMVQGVSEDEKLTVRAIAWDYRRPVNESLKIESGDWAKEISERRLHT